MNMYILGQFLVLALTQLIQFTFTSNRRGWISIVFSFTVSLKTKVKISKNIWLDMIRSGIYMFTKYLKKT